MSKSQLSDISLPVKDELERFNGLFRKSMKSDVKLVDIIANFILRQKGKKIRPLLVMLSASAAGEINERTYRGAILVELLHTATLIHDDVVDNAETRRGLPSINALWKNKVGVLMGDYLLSRGLMIAVENGDHDFLKVITDAVKRMSEGELLQISKTRKLNIDEETYFRIISDKTASLLSTCCEIGAMSATADSKLQQAMRCFGESIGIAFQIRDDILDYVGSPGIIGKPLGGDIREKKITLPLIYSLKKAGQNGAGEIIRLIKKGGPQNVSRIIEFVKEQGGIEYSAETASEYAAKAKQQLNAFPDSQAKQSMLSLVDFIVDRKN